MARVLGPFLRLPFCRLPVFLLSGLLTAQAFVSESLDASDTRWRGASVVADGVHGGAAHFDGDTAHIDVGPCPIDGTLPFTLRCALRTTHAGFCTPLMARHGEAVALSLVLGRSPGVISFEAWSWGSVRIPSVSRIDDGQWHRIEVSYEPESRGALLFVDGALQGGALLGEGRSPQAMLRLGDNIGAHQPFPGDIDALELTPELTHAELFATLQPIVPVAERAAALTALRDRLLPPRTPSLAADAAAAWPERRLAVRRHVQDALGLLPPPPDVPFEVEVHGELAAEGVVLQRVSWIGFPGQRATGWLWLPKEHGEGRRPAILCPHGHWQNGAIHPVVQARCAAFARLGWLALAVDSVHVEDVASGVNSVGAMTWHNQRALGWLLARDDVDPTRVAVTGASGGGQQTYYLMALEDRLAAAAPIVMACYWREILSDTGAHCGCNHVPRAAATTDVPEMCAVFAPKPAFFGTVTGDWTHNFPTEGLPELTAHWLRLGGRAPGSRHGDEGHNYDRPMREAVYGFLHDALIGPPDAHAEVAEPPGAVFAAADLQPLLRQRPNARLDPRAMAREYLARRPRVASWRDLAPGLAFDIERKAIEWHDSTSPTWRCGVVRGADGVPIPLRLREQPETGVPFRVIVDPRGASIAAAAVTGEPDPDFQLALVDPRPYGEWQRYRSAWQRNGLLLGRGEGYQAAVDIALACASLPGEGPIQLVGRGEAGIPSLLAAGLCNRIVEVDTDELGRDFAADGNRLPLCPE
ncbi:MAG: hypothetical protein KDE27_01685, partial [Planctomycetes bacterium]|nr:hypothetical protein [Planctomycetota bacterium]